MSNLNSRASRMLPRRPQAAPDKVGRKCTPARCGHVCSDARRQPGRCTVAQ